MHINNHSSRADIRIKMAFLLIMIVDKHFYHHHCIALHWLAFFHQLIALDLHIIVEYWQDSQGFVHKLDHVWGFLWLFHCFVGIGGSLVFLRLLFFSRFGSMRAVGENGTIDRLWLMWQHPTVHFIYNLSAQIRTNESHFLLVFRCGAFVCGAHFHLTLFQFSNSFIDLFALFFERCVEAKMRTTFFFCSQMESKQ